MNINLLNSAKSCFADNRSAALQGMQYLNMAGTAAYLTSAISDETYSIVLLFGIAGGFAFNLIDCIVSSAADQNIPSMSEAEAKEKAEMYLRAAKAEAAFHENPSLRLFLEMQFDFPSSETLQSMGTWEQIKEYASLLKTPFSVYLGGQQACFMWNTYGNFWYPLVFSQILAGCFEAKRMIDEFPRDVDRLDQWMKTLKELSPDELEHPVYQELQEHFAPTLNRVIARRPELGFELAAQFQSTVVRSKNS